MISWFNRKKEKFDYQNIIKIIYIPRFAIKLALILFDKYKKNKSKNQELFWIKKIQLSNYIKLFRKFMRLLCAYKI